MTFKRRLKVSQPEDSHPANRGMRRPKRAVPERSETMKNENHAIPEASQPKEVAATQPADLPCPAEVDADIGDSGAIANVEEKPDPIDGDQLLWVQMFRATPSVPGQPDLSLKLVPHAMGLVNGLKPKDAMESIVGRCLVATSMASMECFALSANPTLPAHLREANIRLGLKATEAVVQVAKTLAELQNRPTGKEQPANYTVNVEEGGQAIVGNVNRPLPKSTRSSVEDVQDDKE